MKILVVVMVATTLLAMPHLASGSSAEILQIDATTGCPSGADYGVQYTPSDLDPRIVAPWAGGGTQVTACGVFQEATTPSPWLVVYAHPFGGVGRVPTGFDGGAHHVLSMDFRAWAPIAHPDPRAPDARNHCDTDTPQHEAVLSTLRRAGLLNRSPCWNTYNGALDIIAATRERQAALGIDAEHTVLWGYSLGGHAVTLAAMLDGFSTDEPTFGYVVSDVGALDLFDAFATSLFGPAARPFLQQEIRHILAAWGEHERSGGAMLPAIRGLMGTPVDAPDIYRQLSPAYNPAAFCMQGSADAIDPPDDCTASLKQAVFLYQSTDPTTHPRMAIQAGAGIHAATQGTLDVSVYTLVANEQEQSICDRAVGDRSPAPCLTPAVHLRKGKAIVHAIVGTGPMPGHPLGGPGYALSASPAAGWLESIADHAEIPTPDGFTYGHCIDMKWRNPDSARLQCTPRFQVAS